MSPGPFNVSSTDQSVGPAVRKVDFSKVSRKKTQTPKKKAAFTPLRKVLDIKPKLEPESPVTQPRWAPSTMAAEQEHRSGVRAMAETKDVKPDVDGLQDLLGGLTINR